MSLQGFFFFERNDEQFVQNKTIWAQSFHYIAEPEKKSRNSEISIDRKILNPKQNKLKIFKYLETYFEISITNL